MCLYVHISMYLYIYTCLFIHMSKWYPCFNFIVSPLSVVSIENGELSQLGSSSKPVCPWNVVDSLPGVGNRVLASLRQ